MALIHTNRDLRVDLFRGVALWWIFIDHIPANWIAQFSLRNFALCDATEIFVLLAGYAAGLAYGRSMDRHGWVFAAADVIKRAWTLYIAHIFLFVVFSAQVSYSATALDRSEYLDEIHLDVLAEAPYRAMLEALKLSFQPAYLNILPMYVALLAWFAALLPLLRWPPVLFLLSMAVYAVARATGANFPSWTGGGWYFNPVAWQFLFIIGAILAAIAGVMYASNYGTAQHTMGFLPGLKAFTAAVFGGIGNLAGAVVGGILLGLIESIGSGYIGTLTGGVLGSNYSDIFAFIVLIFILTLRPSGLLGERVADRA